MRSQDKTFKKREFIPDFVIPAAHGMWDKLQQESTKPSSPGPFDRLTALSIVEGLTGGFRSLDYNCTSLGSGLRRNDRGKSYAMVSSF